MTVATTPPASGFFANIASWFNGAVGGLLGGVKAEAVAIEPAVLASFESLVGQLVPFAATAAGEVEQAALSGAISSGDKRSAVIGQIGNQAKSLGYSLEQQGVASAINLAAEFGVSLFKMATGQSVGAPAGAS